MKLESNGEFEEDERAVSPAVMGAVLVGLVVLAALICAILWHFTHRDSNAGQEDYASEPVVITEESGADDASAEIEETFDAAEDDGAAEIEGLDDLDGSAAESEAEGPDEEALEPSEGIAEEAGEGTAAVVVSDGESMSFTAVQETVMAKDVINLRSKPSTAEADNIVTQTKNGEALTRTGINSDTGWSRIDYQGQTLYAVSQYLTTDLSYQAPVQKSNPNRVSTKDGRVILFEDCDDTISPKEYVNLRTEPSTSEGGSTVYAQLNYGETAHRTGYSTDSGWSRVEYDGQVLYVVTSMIYTVTE